MKNEDMVKFGQDLFRLSGEKGLQIVELEERNGRFYIQTPTDQEFKEVLDELVEDKWTMHSKTFDQASNSYEWGFILEDGALDGYNYQFVDTTIDVTALDLLDENKEKTVTKVEGPQDNIIHFDDGSIQVDLDAWTFVCIKRPIGNLLRPMGNVGMLMTFDWTELVGQFLADEEFKDDELLVTGSQTGRWAIRGVSPFGKETLYIIHDENGGDLPMVQSEGSYGVMELGEWFKDRFEDKTPEVYERKVKLSDGTIERYGVDDEGKPYNTWHRCGWLKELGL